MTTAKSLAEPTADTILTQERPHKDFSADRVIRCFVQNDTTACSMHVVVSQRVAT